MDRVGGAAVLNGRSMALRLQLQLPLLPGAATVGEDCFLHLSLHQTPLVHDVAVFGYNDVASLLLPLLPLLR